jgi:UDP-N-acetylglucosamine--N-acetylmuramyl-(pentapeptide) pyrophosphoryl-undecaprenol N-acetylglucosamine transferase
VALGGYGSVGPGLAAWLLGRPLVLLEQNSIPGKATRLLSLFADVVCTAWPETVAGLWRRSFAVVTGNPLRPEILSGDAEGAACAAGFEQGKPVLLVLGGSQGASAVNRWVTGALAELARALPDLQVIHQTGERDCGWVAEAYGRTGLRARVTPFLTDIGDCYALASVVLARAGATTLSELAAAGLPAILVPYPYAADDHQRANAQLAAARGGAVVVEEAEFARTSLASLVGELLADDDRRRRMAEALRRMARPQATSLVGRCVQALLLHPHARGAALVAGNGR